jgi:hypothetical protein
METKTSKPSLAAFASSQPQTSPNVSAPMWTGMGSGLPAQRCEASSISPQVAAALMSYHGSEQQQNVRHYANGNTYEDNDLPTLRELVKVGTTGAATSNGTSTKFASSNSTAPTWLGMGAGQPGRLAEAQGARSPDSMIIALDVDEVLVQYVDGFRKYMQRERPNGPLDTDSIFHEAHNPTSPWRLQFALSGGLDNLDAVPGAAAALQRFRSNGIRLEAVTSRPPIMRQSTEALLGKLFPPDTFAAYHFVGPGGKGSTCVAIGARALVDDQYPNCVDVCGCGVTSVLFDYCGSYPWSQNLPEMPANCKKCETWQETSTFLLGLFGIRAGGHSMEAIPGQPSDYLLKVKQVVSDRNDMIVDYRDALSEAGKQATEYDEMEYGANRENQGWAKATQQAPRSEPWWQMRDEAPPPLVQSSATVKTAYKSLSHHQDDRVRSDLYSQLRDEKSHVPLANYQLDSTMQRYPQEYAHGRPTYQQPQSSPNLQQSQQRREALRTWNGQTSEANGYVLEAQKPQTYAYESSTYPMSSYVREGMPPASMSTLSRGERYGGYETSSPYSMSYGQAMPVPVSSSNIREVPVPGRIGENRLPGDRISSKEEEGLCTIS